MPIFTCICLHANQLGQKLKEALDMQLFQQAADDQFAWIREAKKHLDSDNIGKDLLSVRFLLKKHEVLYMYVSIGIGLSLCSITSRCVLVCYSLNS